MLQILHNISVSEFLRDGCSDPKKLVEVLVTVKVWNLNSVLDAFDCSDTIAAYYLLCDMQ